MSNQTSGCLVAPGKMTHKIHHHTPRPNRLSLFHGPTPTPPPRRPSPSEDGLPFTGRYNHKSQESFLVPTWHPSQQASLSVPSEHPGISLLPAPPHTLDPRGHCFPGPRHHIAGGPQCPADLGHLSRGTPPSPGCPAPSHRLSPPRSSAIGPHSPPPPRGSFREQEGPWGGRG